MNAIKIKELVKKYDKFTLGPVDVEIPQGMIIGLIGENGAGKTTLIKAILNIIYPASGTVEFSENIKKEDIGIVLDNIFFPEIIMVKDVDTIMRGVYKTWDSPLFIDYLQKFGLPKDKQIKTLSKGMRKKLEIATALAHHPKLLILDEPTSGLDPVVRAEVLDIFMRFLQDEEHTILFSTHITSDLEHIADRIIFMDAGKIILNEEKDTLLEDYAVLKCGLDEFVKIAKEDMVSYQKKKYGYEVLIKNKEKMSKKYKDFVIDKISLEDFMVLMIKGEKIC